MADVTNDTIRTTYTPLSLTGASLVYFEDGGAYAFTVEELRQWLEGQAYSGIELTRYSETTAAATASVDRADGGRQTLTLTADVTLTIAMNSGEDLELTILNGDTWQVAWPAGDWLGGSLPVLGAKTRVIVDKDSTGTLNFSLVGDYS